MSADQSQGGTFAARYRLERKLGSGGMADVWLAEDTELGRRVAVKILHERYASDEQFVERFRREATHAAGLSHPNIVSIFDRGEADGAYYIVMEYVEGRTLKELIVTRGYCPVPIAVSYVRQILAALRYAHRNGIIHRDIKPHNVIVDREGRVKVADFGIARAGTSQITEAGSIIGTAQYLSPEQARGAPVDESSDLYSTGVVLYELLTGAVPFNGESPVEIAMKHLSQAPEPPSTLRHEVPRDLDLVVMRALAKEPVDRYRSAQEMDRDLELVTQGEAVGRETEEAATMVMRGETTAVTVAAGSTKLPSGVGGEERYRAYDGEVRRRRSVWPWVVAAIVAVALGAGGWFLYDNVQNELQANEPVAVDNYTGLLEVKAVQLIVDDGFVPRVRRIPHRETAKGYVFQQEPEPGTRLTKGSIVTVLVSSGKPVVTVPVLVGKSRDSAVKELTTLGLDAKVVEVNSDQPPGTVTAQDPTGGTRLISGSTVRINVSKGVKEVAVPNVVGLSYDVAAAQLQGAGFSVAAPVSVDSSRPKNEVVAQDPVGNSTAPKGASITLTISKGPTTVTVPDVTLQPLDQAQETLTAAQLKVTVVQQTTEDISFNGVVISQDPPGNVEVEPDSIVTLTVGVYVAPDQPATPPVTTDSTSTDTGTTDTPAAPNTP